MSNKKYRTADVMFGKAKRRKNLKKAQKYVKRNREERAPRRKQWVELAFDDGVEALADERIMPRDEGERRQAVEKAAITVSAAAIHEGGAELSSTEGLVLAVGNGLCRVEIGPRVILCSLRGSLSAHESGYSNVIASGDRVIVGEHDHEAGVIERVLPRRNVLARPETGAEHLKQLLAANIDQLLIVASWRNPHLWPELIDRYLITAERNGIEPLICVNKIDLMEDADELDATLAPYHAAGYTILLTSAATGAGIDAMREALRGKISVLAGLSGVGKSSLLAAVEPGFELRTGAVNAERGQGRHTTTQATMLPFGGGGYVIDTPGIREFGLAGLQRDELAAFYPEIAELATGCRFHDCTHGREPGCAVRTAAQRGDLNATRYKSYKKLLATLPG